MIVKPPWRTLIACIVLLSVFLLGYHIWTPGRVIHDGSHDLKSNGIWLQHGWLGDNKWFQQHKKNPQQFRNLQNILQLKNLLVRHHITDVYPHLAPCRKSGEIPAVDPKQTRQFLRAMNGLRIIPWVGGVLEVHAFPERPDWRNRFTQSITDLLTTYPAISGIHINIEPLPSGNSAFIELLYELEKKLPPGKILSVAAYPPPTIYQMTRQVHWDQEYYQMVSRHADQIVAMMYDTSLQHQKLYQHLMRSWTQEILAWSGVTDVLLGVPVYDDSGVNYHYPHVENLKNSLAGIHAGLAGYNHLPENYRGIAIYSEWEMEPEEWDYLRINFSKR